MLVATSTGDVLLVGVLAGVATLDLLTGGVAIAAGLATLFRWGSPSLTAVAGSQAVLGPGGLVGPAAGAASAWLAAAAVVLVAPRSPGPAIALGLLAADLVAGPAPPHFVAARVAASVVAVGAAVIAPRRLPLGPARAAAGAAVVAACILAALS